MIIQQRQIQDIYKCKNTNLAKYHNIKKITYKKWKFQETNQKKKSTNADYVSLTLAQALTMTRKQTDTATIKSRNTQM